MYKCKITVPADEIERLANEGKGIEINIDAEVEFDDYCDPVPALRIESDEYYEIEKDANFKVREY